MAGLNAANYSLDTGNASRVANDNGIDWMELYKKRKEAEQAQKASENVAGPNIQKYEGGGDIGTGIVSGGVTGASLGSSINAGWGTLIGGVLGAAAGGISAGISGGEKAKKVEEANAEERRRYEEETKAAKKRAKDAERSTNFMGLSQIQNQNKSNQATANLTAFRNTRYQSKLYTPTAGIAPQVQTGVQNPLKAVA